MRISPLPNLPMTGAGGGLVLNAMVSVVPDGGRLDHAGLVRAGDRRRSLPLPLIVSARFLTADSAVALAADVALGTAARVHRRRGMPMVAMRGPAVHDDLARANRLRGRDRARTRRRYVGGRSQARRAERRVDIGGDLICGLRHARREADIDGWCRR